MKNQIKKEKGFTIIEVMIVLAIAGLILLIVFLAVPALQRNSRNTERRNQAAAYTSAVQEYINNNNGTIPTTSTISQVNSLAADGRLSEPTSVTTTASQTGSLTMDSMQLVTNTTTGARCAATAGNTEPANSNRSLALRYTIEGSNSSVIMQCINVQ